MKNLELLLLNDSFNHVDAKELIVKAIDKKINFYKLKNLQYQIRYEMPDYSVQQKLAQLQDSREELLKLIDQARQRQSELRIEAAVCVEPYSPSKGFATGTFG